jgi:hypothetical protein
MLCTYFHLAQNFVSVRTSLYLPIFEFNQTTRIAPRTPISRIISQHLLQAISYPFLLGILEIVTLSMAFTELPIRCIFPHA